MLLSVFCAKYAGPCGFCWWDEVGDVAAAAAEMRVYAFMRVRGEVLLLQRTKCMDARPRCLTAVAAAEKLFLRRDANAASS